MKMAKLGRIGNKRFYPVIAASLIAITVLAQEPVLAKDLGDVKALIKVKQALKEHPDSVMAHIKYQDAMIEDGWREQMISEYGGRLKKQGETPENIYLLARLKEDIEAQAAVYNDLIKKFPDFTWGYFGSAHISWKRGDRLEAIKLFERVLGMDPKHTFAYQWITYIYEKQNDYKKAEEIILMGLQHLPDDAELLAYHATCLKDLERYEEALAQADLALKIEPENELALRQRGWILALMKRDKDAAAAIEAYLELWPSSDSMLEILGSMYYELYRAPPGSSKNLDKAEEAWLKALELSPNSGSLYLNLHFIYLKRSWPVHLLWYAQKGLKLAPNDGNAGVAQTNIGSGAGMSAVSSSSQGIEIKRPEDYIRSRRDMSDKELALPGKQDNETAWNALEQALAGSSRPQKEGIDELIKKFPEFAPAYYNRGVLGMWSYKDAEALSYLEKAVSLVKEWGRGYGALAAAQLRLRRYRNGRLTLKTAQALAPDNPEIQFNVKLMKMFDEAVVGQTISELEDTLELIRSKPEKAERVLFGMSMFGDYLKRDPESAQIHELYADIFAASQDDSDWKTALETYRKAIELGGDKDRLSAKIAEVQGRKK